MFQPLGILSGDREYSSAGDISADGMYIAGLSSSADSGWNGGLREAVRWSAEGSIQGLGFLPDSDRNSRGYAISPDGAWVVGEDTFDSDTMAMAWSADTGPIALGRLEGGTNRSTATAVAGNGQAVVGYSGSARAGEFGAEAFMWTPQDGIRAMGFLGPDYRGDYGSGFNDITADGSVAVGGSSAPDHGTPITWDAQNGMQALPMHPDLWDSPVTGGWAKAISNDGRWITGNMMLTDPAGDNEFLDEAVVWTPDGEIIRLGQLYGSEFRSTNALDISESGVVVGSSNSIHNGTEPFIWDPQHGMRNFVDVLRDEYGFDPAEIGWRLSSLTAISPDGTVLVGGGFNRNELRSEAFMIRLVPAPSTLIPVAAGGVLALRRRRTD